MKRKVKRPFDNEQFRKGYVAGMFAAEKELNTELLHFAEKAHKIMSEGTFPDYGIKINFKDSHNTIATNLDMKTEEKAKRYDEALEWMREVYPTLTGAAKEDAEHYFPELKESKESKDERIRKAIVTLIKDLQHYSTNYAGVDPTEMLAWLEKQKENPKSADSISSDCVSDAKCENRWHKVGDSLPDSAREVICKDAIGNFFIGRYYKESGSWEVSMYDDVDKSNEDNPPVIMWCDIPSENQKKPDVTWTEEDDAKVKVMCKEGDLKPSERAWLKELKNRIVKKEQKPVEFDEYKIIKKHITEDSLSSEVNKRLTECGWYVTDEKLKEWSEDDEHRCKDAIYFLETAKKHYACTSEIELTIEWLKSLRPQSKDEIHKEKNEKPKHTEVWVEGRTIFEQDANTFVNTEGKPEAKLTGWVARDRDGEICIYKDYPEKDSKGQFWLASGYMPLDQKSFPDLKWEDEPVEVEVEITIRKK